MHDPHADRVVLLPTAWTQPRGTLYITSYDLVILQAGYALTDHTQVSLTVTPPIEGQIVLLDLSLKSVLFRHERVRAAALGSVSGLAGLEDLGTALVGRAGGVVQLCLEAACDGSIVVASNLTLAGPVLILWNGVGAILPLARYLSVLLEIDTLLPLGSEAGQLNGVALSAGIRIPGRRWSFDLAITGVPEAGTAVPVLALTWRP